MASDTNQVLQQAEKLGEVLAQHPAVEKYKQAQKAVADDPEAGRLLSEFDRQLEALARLEQSGGTLSDAQRMQLESMQTRIVSNIKIKALNMAQVEFVDLLRKASQTYQRPLMGATGAAPAAGQSSAGGPRLTMPR
ncbi:MAG TPA: YlbF family regulator [Tepidisphaeraceae bacterium]|nr:YlbF family regulator [Tepidisphaeraceae bacterium]